MSSRRLLLLLPLLAGLACTEASLIKIVEDPQGDPYDNKLKLSGKVCTTDPSDLVFPLKVLFMIDTSQSMNVNDPVSTTEPDPLLQTNRCRAVRDVIIKFIDLLTPVGQLPTYCNTGTSGCEKGSTKCAGCGIDTHMCVGPDCVSNSTFKGAPVCPPPTTTNGTCVPLCDAKVAGCAPGEKSCPACRPGDQCLSGVCGKHLDPGVEFALLRFGSAKQVLTKNTLGKEGFTSDVKELVTSLPMINNGGSVTDYEGALSEAFKVLYQDMRDMQDQNAAAVSRSKYVVIFLSDGQPDPKINDQEDWDTIPDSLIRDLVGDPNNTQNITEYNVDARILRRVQDIMGLRTLFHIGDIKLHTAYLAASTPSWLQDQATHLLRQMSSVGKGTFRNFQNGEEINFLHVDFSSLRRVFRLKSLLVSDVNARPFGGSVLIDSDGDGLDDGLERTAGTKAALPDTDGDGFSDTVEHFFRTSGWDALNPSDADCSLKANDMDGDGRPDDGDGDGLADCEERFLGTSRDLIDSDADGIPDGLEIAFGTNPTVADLEDDPDSDGMPNGDEIRLHTDPRSDDAFNRVSASYRYLVQQVGSGIETVGWRCLEDQDCPRQADCRGGYCRCFDDTGCSSFSDCSKDADCTVVGERCVGNKCQGSSWTCQAPPPGEEGSEEQTQTESFCAARKHITCYQYEVENITLVTPQASGPGAEHGWNQVNLYFGEVPFDNPMDYGLFRMACVRARYLSENGSKLPAVGRLEVPETAWHDPRELSRGYSATETDPAGKMPCGVDATGALVHCNPGDLCLNATSSRCGLVKCVCPDGKEGICPAP